MRSEIKVFLLVSALSGSVLLIALFMARRPAAEHHPHARALAGLDQTLLPVSAQALLQLPNLVGSDAKTFTPGRLRGHWSVLFFGFSSCPDVCPTTLRTLSEVAKSPASGVSKGQTQMLFITVDPDTDTPAQLQSYLQAFDSRMLGLSGSQQALARYRDAVGAASQAKVKGFDHSTSLFVLDPEARLVGVLLRPSDPARIIADLKTLRQTYAQTAHPSERHPHVPAAP